MACTLGEIFKYLPIEPSPLYESVPMTNKYYPDQVDSKDKYSTLQCQAVQFRTVQHNAVLYNAM